MGDLVEFLADPDLADPDLTDPDLADPDLAVETFRVSQWMDDSLFCFFLLLLLCFLPK